MVEEPLIWKHFSLQQRKKDGLLMTETSDYHEMLRDLLTD